MPITRSYLLNAIEPGDVFFAVASDESPRIMLAYRTDESSIFARLVTSQTKTEFGRDGKSVDGDEQCTIVSAAPLGVYEYGVMLGLDRKMRLFHSLEHIRLTEDEKSVLDKIEAFYRARPLPID
jgi:hypothetical protein